MMANSLRDPAEDFWANLRQQRRPFCRTQGVATLVLDLLATLWLSGLVRAQGKRVPQSRLCRSTFVGGATVFLSLRARREVVAPPTQANGAIALSSVLGPPMGSRHLPMIMANRRMTPPKWYDITLIGIRTPHGLRNCVALTIVQEGVRSTLIR